MQIRITLNFEGYFLWSKTERMNSLRKFNKFLTSLIVVVGLIFTGVTSVNAAVATTSHGGHYGRNMMDPGAIGSGYKEAEVAQRINKRFMELTGAKDASDFKGTSVNQNLYNIVQNMNKYTNSGDLNVSHHLNAFNGKATGVEVWYYRGDEFGKQQAEKVAAAISKATGLYNRGAKATTDFYVIRNSVAHTILIEWAFIDNPSDMQKLNANFDNAVKSAANALGANVAVNPKPAEPQKPSESQKPAESKPVASKWISETGTFTSHTTIKIRNGASTSSGYTGVNYYPGESVNYNAFTIDQNGYVWIRYKDWGGTNRYMATGQSKNGVRVNYWGTFR